MRVEEKWDIQPICKTCFYRRPIDSYDKVHSSTYWQHTVCHYLLDTDQRRSGNPQGDYCPNYKPKAKRKRK